MVLCKYAGSNSTQIRAVNLENYVFNFYFVFVFYFKCRTRRLMQELQCRKTHAVSTLTAPLLGQKEGS